MIKYKRYIFFLFFFNEALHLREIYKNKIHKNKKIKKNEKEKKKNLSIKIGGAGSTLASDIGDHRQATTTI